MSDLLTIVKGPIMDSIIVNFVDGTTTQIKRSLLPRFKSVNSNIPTENPLYIKMDGLERFPFLKIVEWMEHYNVGYKFDQILWYI